MDYTILAFIALIFYGMTFSLCVMILEQYKHAKRLARYELYLELERVESEYYEADRFIRHNLNGLVYGNYDYQYLRSFLAEHLRKYPDAKLPKQSGTIIFSGEHSTYTLNFYDATDIRIEKYLKPCIKLLKEPKPKKINILKQATKIVRTRKSKVLTEA